MYDTKCCVQELSTPKMRQTWQRDMARVFDNIQRTITWDASIRFAIVILQTTQENITNNSVRHEFVMRSVLFELQSREMLRNDVFDSLDLDFFANSRHSGVSHMSSGLTVTDIAKRTAESVRKPTTGSRNITLRMTSRDSKPV